MLQSFKLYLLNILETFIQVGLVFLGCYIGNDFRLPTTDVVAFSIALLAVFRSVENTRK